MYSKFENMDEEKQKRILNAAMKEFAANGYDDASTNEIVKNADISKGLLFHYFKNKKQLFLYLFDNFIEMFVQELAAKVNMEERDFFQRIRDISALKYQLIHKYPYIIKFLETAYLDDSEEISDELNDRKKKMLDANMAKFLDDIDLTKFKEGYDVGQIINTVVWAFEGIANSHTAGLEMDFEKIFAEADSYIGFFQQCFYKEP